MKDRQVARFAPRLLVCCFSRATYWSALVAHSSRRTTNPGGQVVRQKSPIL